MKNYGFCLIREYSEFLQRLFSKTKTQKPVARKGLVLNSTFIIRKGVFSGRAFYEKANLQTPARIKYLLLHSLVFTDQRSAAWVSLKTTNEATSISSNKSLEMCKKKIMQIKFIMLIK